MKKWTIQKKWTVSSAISIFLSFLVMCIILYFSLQAWLLNAERNTAQNTLNEVVMFFESRGPIISLQDIQGNKTLLNQLLNQEQSVRILNSDGIEILRINDASPFASFQKSEEFVRGKINGQAFYTKTSPIDFGLFTGYVEISHSLEDFEELMDYMFISMTVFALVALFVSAFIGYSLSSFLLKPLQDLRDEMVEAKEHKFLKRVHFDDVPSDEIGEILVLYKELMEQVSETITRQDEFIHNVSHELRTPIQVVEGHLALLNRWGKSDPAVLDESLDISLEEVKRMKTLIEEMLKLAKNEQIDYTVQTSVKEVVDELIKLYKTLAPNTTISYEEDTAVVVAVPKTVLIQIVSNLIDNSIKYNDKEPLISIKSLKLPGEAHISIADNGIGIPEPLLDKIFDRFFTVEEARTKAKGGSGLGLSIVQRLVHAYKGNICVSSSGNGTKFDIKFPNLTIE